MINCEKATYLVEKREIDKLTVKEKINLKLHSAICGLCKHYESDSKHINNLLKSLGIKRKDSCLSEEEKEKMKEKISAS